LPSIPGDCAWDPTVAIGPDHHQYFAYARFIHCQRIPQYAGDGSAAIYLATRASPTSPWREAKRPVVALHGQRFDDRPALAVDLTRNRLYLGWVDYRNYNAPLEVVRSDDDGRTWSRPVAASTPGIRTATSLAVGPHGELYAGWEDAGAARIMAARSTDGAGSFRPERLVADVNESQGGLCGTAIPAQGAHQQGEGCVRPIPSLAVGKDGRVYGVWASVGANGSQDVFIKAMDSALRPLEPARRVNPPDGRQPSDQFLPALAVDASSGQIWICYYDTSGDPRRIRTHYTCTWSDDGGRRFATALRVATVASDERQPGATFYGDYAGLAAAGGIAHPIWTDTRQLKRLGEEVYTAALR
jgi:hypothetical protein